MNMYTFVTAHTSYEEALRHGRELYPLKAPLREHAGILQNLGIWLEMVVLGLYGPRLGWHGHVPGYVPNLSRGEFEILSVRKGLSVAEGTADLFQWRSGEDAPVYWSWALYACYLIPVWKSTWVCRDTTQGFWVGPPRG